MKSIVRIASRIVEIEQGRVTVASTIELPESTLIARQAVIDASVSASAPNIKLSRRVGAARKTSTA